MALIDFRRDKRISDDNRNVLREFCQELGGDPVVLAKSLGLKVYRVDLPWEQDGYTEADADCGAPTGYKIVLNARLPLERQKFTLAHEIGHFVLHRNTPQFKEIERQQDNVIAFPSAFRSVSDAWDVRNGWNMKRTSLRFTYCYPPTQFVGPQSSLKGGQWHWRNVYRYRERLFFIGLKNWHSTNQSRGGCARL